MSQKLGRQQDALSAIAIQHSEKTVFFFFHVPISFNIDIFYKLNR